MHAITTTGAGGTDVLRWTEVADPVPAPGEVLVRTVAAGVNRADLMQRQGFYPPPAGISEVIGLEVSGTVAAVGSEVTGWSVGDPCVALLAGGGYAELVVVPTGQLLRPPAGVDLVTAAGLIEVAATVWSNLRRVGLRSGERFLVHGGTGGIGSFALQYATAVGAVAYATAGSDDKLVHCRDLGAADAFSYRDDWVAEARAATDGRGIDVVLDNMGGAYLEPNVAVLATEGRIVTIGLQGGTKGTLDLGALLRLRGQLHATSLRHRPLDQKAEICAGVEREVWPLIADGTIRTLRETRIRLPEAARAHELLESGGNLGKIVLVAP